MPSAVAHAAVLLCLCTVAFAAVSDAEFYALQAKLARISSLTEKIEAEMEVLEKDPLHARQLAGHEAVSIDFEHPDAAVAYANGARLAEVPTNDSFALSSSNNLVVQHDLHIHGDLRVDGADLSLGVPLVADEDIMRGDILSMVSSGGVAKGFGMALSAAVASLPVSYSEISIVAHSDTLASVLYLDEDYTLWALRMSSTGSTDLPVEVHPDEVITTFSAAAVSEGQLLVCYKVNSTLSGHCRAATHTGLWEFGTALQVQESSVYDNGVVAVLHGTTDRAVLVYSMAEDPNNIATEECKAQILSINSNTVMELSVPFRLESSKTDHMSAVAITSSRMIVAYRVVRGAVTQAQELYFADPTVRSSLRSHHSVTIGQSDASDFTHTAMDRLGDDSVLLAFRQPEDGNQVTAAILKAEPPVLSVGPFTTVDAGREDAGERGELHVSVTAPQPTRVGFAFLNARTRPVFVDAGVFGESVVMGRPQVVAAEDGSAAAVAAVRMSETGSMVVYQPPRAVQFPEGQSVLRSTMFGGPTILGFAKNDAAAGEPVTVVLQGALDAYSGLLPGAPYYARYDGGVATTPDPDSGASSAVVGKALSPTTLLSTIGSDGEETRSRAAALETDMSTIFLHHDETMSRLDRLWSSLGNSHYVRKDLAIFRWAFWHTYSNHHGWFYSDNTAMAGGLHSSTWSNSNGRPYQATNSKLVWAALFNKLIYAVGNAVVWAEEWYSYSSNDSGHVGALMRIKNTTPNPITWTMSVVFARYSGWSENAGIALNGVDVGPSVGGSCYDCQYDVELTLPPNRVSTVYVVSGSGPPSGTRPSLLAFDNDCLYLPEGLEWVDDLHYNYQGGTES